MSDGPALFLNGTYGVGKSAVLDHVGDLLADAGRPFTLMDVDAFHRSWPPAADDPDNTLIEARNMAAAWRAFREAGPRQLVISGVIACHADLDRYREALAVEIRSVRLTAAPTEIESRLRARYDADRRPTLDWHLQRFADLAARKEQADVDEAVVATDGRSPREVARAVLATLGL